MAETPVQDGCLAMLNSPKLSLLWRRLTGAPKPAEPAKPTPKAEVNAVLRAVPPQKAGTWVAIKRAGRNGHLFCLDQGKTSVIVEVQLNQKVTPWRLDTFVQFVQHDLEAVYKQILAPEVPIDAPIAVLSSAHKALTKVDLTAALASAMTEIEAWAQTVSPSAFIDAAAKRAPGA